MKSGPLLALETSTRLGSVAVGNGGDLLAEVTLGVEIRHSESLLPAIAFALERARLRPADLAGIVVGSGPGSFTGVRITAATGKGMAHALGIPLYAYSSLEAIAVATGMTDRAVCAMFDARRGEVYAACHRVRENGSVEMLMAPAALPVGDVVATLAADEPVYAGEGAAKYAERIEHGGGNVARGPVPIPRASTLLWLAHHSPARGRIEEPGRWQPDYVRAPGARPMT
jgi:tRNA threonylcarbamoyladenosine biosynthesis protein TsaB